MVLVVFSAIHMALNCGNQVFISAGASVPGVIWNTIFTPSMVSSSPVLWTNSVGSISVAVPVETVWPRPALTPPCALRGSSAPNM
ncbi:hypothetical protein D3C78_1198580 [compost metagenome]